MSVKREPQAGKYGESVGGVGCGSGRDDGRDEKRSKRERPDNQPLRNLGAGDRAVRVDGQGDTFESR